MGGGRDGGCANALCRHGFRRRCEGWPFRVDHRLRRRGTWRTVEGVTDGRCRRPKPRTLPPFRAAASPEPHSTLNLYLATFHRGRRRCSRRVPRSACEVRACAVTPHGSSRRAVETGSTPMSPLASCVEKPLYHRRQIDDVATGSFDGVLMPRV